MRSSVIIPLIPFFHAKDFSGPKSSSQTIVGVANREGKRKIKDVFLKNGI